VRTIETSFAPGCSPEIYWGLLLGADYLRGLYQRLGFRELTILELTPTLRILRLRPPRNLPAVLDKLVGDRLVYEHHGVLDPATNLFTWHMVPPARLAEAIKVKQDIVSTRGTTRLESVGGAWHCHETVVMEARLFGLGGLIESTIEKELRASWSKEQAFLREWLDQR
jgi:hypothetical protein